MKKLLLVALLGVALAGCERADPVSSVTTGRGVEVETLFTVDGCKMYRFRDAGITHYFANCPTQQTVSDVRNCGKSCTHREENITVHGDE